MPHTDVMTHPFTCLLFTFLIFSLTLSANKVASQHTVDPHIHMHEHPVLSAIQTEFEHGRITKEDALLQSLYAGFKPERLDSRFRMESQSTGRIRCLTPVLIEYERTKDQLSPATVSEIEEMIAPKSSPGMQTHPSPSGNFIFYYETEGREAVPMKDLDNSGIPDYVEKAAFAADSSYRYQVANLGFQDFLKGEPYEIYFQDFGFYGTTRSSGSTTIINVHKDFEGFPENTHPEGNQIGALYATIAHEIKHAVQYATNRWKGDAGSVGWIEMDATMMEEIVFDDVNDYYNYIKSGLDSSNPNGSSIFGSPSYPIPGSYNHITWSLYFAEKYGMQFWVDVWEEIRIDYLNQQGTDEFISYLDAIERVIEKNSEILEQEHIMNHLWHMTAGPDFITPGFGFEEREEYPRARFSSKVVMPPDTVNSRSIFAKAADYFQVIPTNITPGQPTILLDSDIKGIGIGAIAFFKNGDIDVKISVDPNSPSQTLQTTWEWEDLMDMRIAVVNTNQDSTGIFNLTVTSTIPDEDTITQNYPNPFNPVTNIRFSLNESKDVRVEVYDRIGRKISTLIDERLNRGFHTVQFDGSRLASGVYFYRIVTDQTVSTRKMVLVK